MNPANKVQRLPRRNILEVPQLRNRAHDIPLYPSVNLTLELTGGKPGHVIYRTSFGFVIEDEYGRTAWELIKY